MGICLCLMPAKTEGLGMLKEKKTQEPINDDCSSFIGLSDQTESEIKWVQLHQMFDR